MSTSTQKAIEKIINDCAVVEEAPKPSPEKPAASKTKLLGVKVKKDQWVKVEMAGDFMAVTQKVDGLSVYKKTSLPRPSHVPVEIAPFYVKDFAEFMRIAVLGISPQIQTDGTVKMGTDSVGTTDEMIDIKTPDMKESDLLCTVYDFSVAKACADDMVKPSFNFAFFRKVDKELALCATDSRRLHYSFGAFEINSRNDDVAAIDGAFIPRFALEAHGKIDLFVAGDFFVVFYNNVVLWYGRNEIQVLSEEVVRNVTRQDFGAAVEMGLAIPHLKLAAKNKTASHPVSIMREGEEARLDMRYPDVKGVARVPIVKNKDAFDAFGINAEYLLDALAFTDETILHQNNGQAAMSPMNIVSADGTRVAVIMPIQIKSNEDGDED